MATKLDIYNEAVRLCGAPALAALTDNVELRYALDGEYAEAVDFVLRDIPWRFATAEADVAVDVTTPPTRAGYVSAHEVPAKALRVLSIRKVSGARRLPIDCRLEETHIFTNETGPVTVRFITTDARTESLFPTGFVKTLAAYLAYKVSFRISALTQLSDRLLQTFTINRAEAATREAVPEDAWLRFQLDGSFYRALETILSHAFWRFAQKAVDVPADNPTTGAYPGYTHSYTIPSDHIRTRGLFIRTNSEEHPADIREDGDKWSANVDGIVAHYTSRTLGADPDRWPEEFVQVVGAYLGLYEDQAGPRETEGDQNASAKWVLYMEKAAERLAVKESKWLRFQLAGTFAPGVRSLVWQQQWRWALKTVELTALDPGTTDGTLSYSFTKPADWAAPNRVYKIEFDRECDLAYREGDGVLYADHSPIYLRYVDKDAVENPALWPEYFDNSLYAWLTLQELMEMPDAPAARIQIRQRAFEDTLTNAALRDDMRERPPINRWGGRLVRSRLGTSYENDREHW